MTVGIYRGADGSFGLGDAHSETRDARLLSYVDLRRSKRDLRCDYCKFEDPKSARAIDSNCGVGELAPKIVCPFCYFERRIEMAGHFDCGTLMLFESSPQLQLNWILHSILSCMNESSPEEWSEVLAIFLKIKRGEPAIVHHFGQWASSPDAMGESLRNLSATDYALRDVALKSVRFIPKVAGLDGDVATTYWEPIVEHWRNKIYPRLQRSIKR